MVVLGGWRFLLSEVPLYPLSCPLPCSRRVTLSLGGGSYTLKSKQVVLGTAALLVHMALLLEVIKTSVDKERFSARQSVSPPANMSLCSLRTSSLGGGAYIAAVLVVIRVSLFLLRLQRSVRGHARVEKAACHVPSLHKFRLLNIDVQSNTKVYEPNTKCCTPRALASQVSPAEQRVDCTLGPLGFSSSQHRRTPEIVL